MLTRHAITRHRLKLGTHRALIVRSRQTAVAARSVSIGAARPLVAVAITVILAKDTDDRGHIVTRPAIIVQPQPAVVRDRVRGSGAVGGCERSVVAARSLTWRGIGAAGVGRLRRRLARS